MDVELRRCLSDLHFLLGHDSQDLNAVADGFGTTLSALLLEFDVACVHNRSLCCLREDNFTEHFASRTSF